INTLSFSYENIPEWFIKDLKEKKERNLCLEYSEKYNFNLLGEKIDVLKLKSYFNLFIDEIENSEETKKIHLILKENDENKTYESVQLFKNEHDLEKFFSKKDHLTELQNAEYSIPIYY
ncbi:abortive infection system toxin AbiGii family protein, partial [Faecalibacillus intestinalis]